MVAAAKPPISPVAARWLDSHPQLPALTTDPSIDVLILGAGAAGLLCAATAGQRGRKVRVLERAERIGKKILVSGGGRCNFTNLHATPENYLSDQPAFCRSALARYTPQDFLALVERHGVPYHEKTLGQLFCDRSSRDIVDLLAAECADAGVRVETDADVRTVERTAQDEFTVTLAGRRQLRARSVVVACGGLSWPKLGGSDLAHRLARHFGLRLVPPRPGLVPLTFQGTTGQLCATLSGVALPTRATTRTPSGPRTFHESLLFTHRGLSGPVVLQISSYLSARQELTLDLLPAHSDDENWLPAQHAAGRSTTLANVLAERFPTSMAQQFCAPLDPARPLRQHSPRALATLERTLRRWTLTPDGTEGYGKAEVTLGGVDTRDLSGKTLETRHVPGLYFIGEAVDVTGHLGGFNFQWAWASGHACGEVA